jgi:acyl carrier protein
VADAIESQVIDIIARKRKMDPSAVTLDSTFEQLGIDSLDAADLLFAFEDRFGIVVPDAAAQSMKTVRQVVEGVRQLVGDRAGA